ncbi:CLCA3_4 [Lepeophtheirus salmonis]|uniref:CLCA3_4 n=1 Tax=Lepeophtheirus salmonis TaxID=72036 RepID=A0A7R8CX77_LEPSM|nr:CLCA3_4 [Lepeophtheirus salmonis]CAF2958123.1 CLCA3_4 [Lepeophtheirus salmonis]
MNRNILSLSVLLCALITLGKSEDLITLRLDKKVPHAHCPFIIKNLKKLLVSSSKTLFDLTSTQFNNVHIIVPSNWVGSDCLKDQGVSIENVNHSSEDILVTNLDTLFGDNIITSQYGQCGTPGRLVQLPYASLNKSMESQSKKFVKEWIKYKYGVFEESGLPDDKLYPLYSVEGEVRIRNEGCPPNEEEIICPLGNYNRDLTTKQNILCNGRSIREVLSSSISIDPNNTITYSPPSFTFISPQKDLLTLILDRSSRSHWDLLQKALFQFIARLPIGAYLSVITYGSQDASMNLPPTLITSANRAGLHGRIPRRALEDGDENVPSCLSCGIDMALKMSESNSLTPIWILATGGSTNTILQRVERMDDIQASNISIYAISTASDESYLQDLTPNHFIVQPNLPELSGALNTVLTLATKKSLIHFHKEMVILNSSIDANDKTLVGNFVVEEKLRKNLWIQVIAQDERDIEYFEVLSPTEDLNEAGIWGYSLKLYYYEGNVNETSSYPVYVEVLGEANGDDAVVLESWVSTDYSLEVPRVYLYAKVTLGDVIPVLNADVQAIVYPPNSDEAVIVNLRDTGSGYPDITHGDGIYSAYFTGFGSVSGYYRMSIQATHNGGKALTPKISITEPEFVMMNSETPCCGSSTPVAFTVPTTPFNRMSLPPSFYVEQPSNFYARQGSSDDFFPPSRITDFALDKYDDSESLFVHLKWTAPGGDYDNGQAFRYEIRCYTNKEALRDENFSEMSIPVHATLIPTPEEYGTPQTSTVGVPWGRISNTISVFIKEELITTTPLLSNELEPDQEEVAFYSGEQVAHDNLTIYLIATGISIILVLLIIGSALGILKYYRTISRAKDMEDGSNTTTSSLSGTLKKIMALPDVTPEKGHLWTTSTTSHSITPTSLSDYDSSCKVSEYKQGLQTATSQKNPGIHRVDETVSTPKVNSEYYESSDAASEKQ